MAEKRKRYTIELKYEVGLKIEKRETAANLSTEYKIPPSVIAGWRKDRTKIRDEFENCRTLPKSKSMKKESIQRSKKKSPKWSKI